MRKLMLLLTLTSLFLPTAYSQNTAAPNFKEINKFLAEGLECKEILVIKNNVIHNLDSASAIKDTILKNKDLEINAHEKKENIMSEEIVKQDKVISKQAEQIADEQKKTNKQQTRKKFWRGFAIVEAGVIALVAAVIFLL